MQEFDFVLKFKLPDPAAPSADFIEALGEVGCTDALVGTGQMGLVAFDFTREAASAHDAVTSAIKDVQTAIPGANLVEAAPDIVGLSEVADLLGYSRQYLRKIACGSALGFPSPIHEGKPSIWHLAPVLGWFMTSRQRDVDSALMDLARVNMHLNLVISEVGSDAAEIDGLRALLT